VSEVDASPGAGLYYAASGGAPVRIASATLDQRVRLRSFDAVVVAQGEKSLLEQIDDRSRRPRHR
jgi:hypothetical protein